MALRLQCMDSSIGLRKTPSEKSAPMPRQIMTALTARTTQP